MQWFKTPTGEAGCDQLDAMEESVQAAIEQMFWQVAKRDSLEFGVGRAAEKQSSNPDRDMRLDAQKRECEGLIVFHAGKALETSLQVIYAKINNRIPGREYPGVPDERIKRDRRSHSLVTLYSDILKSVESKSDLRERLESEFESIYQTAVHRGVNDLIVDGEVIDRIFLKEDVPFREARIGGLRHGAEYTIDHSGFHQLLTPPEGESEFSRYPCRNFPEFLAKADAAYYGKRNMRWASYSPRDHERGRPYVVVGTRFFARLVQGLVAMANEQWLWDRAFAQRWHERRRVIVGDMVRHHISQSFTEDVELPDMRSADEMLESYGSTRSSRTDDYDSIHCKWQYDRSRSADESDRT